MLKLLIKDYYLHKRSTFIFLLMITGYCIWISFTIPPALVYAGFSAIFVSMIPIAALAREDKLQSVVLDCSLPGNRDEIVRYRFLSGWMVTLAGLVYVFGLGLLVPGSRIAVDDLLSLKAVFFYLTVGTIFLASIAPFVIRFGWAGMIVFLLGAQFFGVLALLILLFLFTAIGIQSLSGYLSGVTSALIDPEYLRNRGYGIVRSLEEAYDSYGALLTYGFLAIIAAVAAFISMGVSIHSYNKREF